MKRRFCVALIPSSFLFLILGGGVQGEKDLTTESVKKQCEELISKDHRLREIAWRNLIRTRSILADSLIGELKELSKSPDPAFESPMHLIIQTLGEWRVSEANSLLLDIIDFELDKSTFPHGDKLPLSAYFPVADALQKIGGSHLSKMILGRLRTESEGKKVCLYLWVLYSVYSSDVAEIMIEKKVSEEKNDASRHLLEKARNLLIMGERLLIFDK